MKRLVSFFIFSSLFTILAGTQVFASNGAVMQSAGTTPWWVWPIILFIVTYLIGIIAAVLAGLMVWIYLSS